MLFYSIIVSEYEINRKVARTVSDGSKKYSDKNYNMIKLNHSAPVNFKEKEFNDKLKKVSPQFVKIYNQVFKAEEIKSTWMMKCLKDYIDNDKIKTLAENLNG